MRKSSEQKTGLLIENWEAFQRRLTEVVFKVLYAAVPEKVLVVNDKENRDLNSGTERCGVELLNLRYKPRKEIKGTENIRLRLRIWQEKESAMGDLFSDCIVPGVKQARLHLRLLQGTGEVIIIL